MGRDGEHCGVAVAAPLRKGWDRDRTQITASSVAVF